MAIVAGQLPHHNGFTSPARLLAQIWWPGAASNRLLLLSPLPANKATGALCHPGRLRFESIGAALVSRRRAGKRLSLVPLVWLVCMAFLQACWLPGRFAESLGRRKQKQTRPLVCVSVCLCVCVSDQPSSGQTKAPFCSCWLQNKTAGRPAKRPADQKKPANRKKPDKRSNQTRRDRCTENRQTQQADKNNQSEHHNCGAM